MPWGEKIAVPPNSEYRGSNTPLRIPSFSLNARLTSRSNGKADMPSFLRDYNAATFTVSDNGLTPTVRSLDILRGYSSARHTVL